MSEPGLFRFDSVSSDGLNGQLLLERLYTDSFAVLYDFESKSTFIKINCENSSEKINLISNTIDGLSFSVANKLLPFKKASVSLFYKSTESIREDLFSDIFRIGIESGILGIVFVPLTTAELGNVKAEMEKTLSSMPNRFNSTWRNFLNLGSGDSTSFQHEIFDNSEESGILKEALEQINFAIMSNGVSYKIALFHVSDPEYKNKISEYLHSKVLVMGATEISVDNAIDVFDYVNKTKMIPFGNFAAAKLLKPYGEYDLKYIINSKPSFSDSGIKIGSVKYSSNGYHRDIKMPKNLFNLGFIISGLPGTGKTSEAMGIISQLSRQEEKPKIVVIAPTNEWDNFGKLHGMHVIKLCSDGIPINFFMPPKGIEIKRFYQDLSMLLASASESGPYQKPLEKCLLNAFRRYYSNNKVIDPISVYKEISESIVELHGSRSNTGVKYTKHGENIKSSLEGLIEILQFPEYSGNESINIGKLMEDGVIFDVSEVSVQMKSFFYALILNQLYSETSKFDTNGDGSLRMVICVEEAQLLFKDPKSATVMDIRSRIQDFRKLGVGLMLLVHSITDIDQDIRRLCQSKIYLKQPTDVAKKALEDLVFFNVEEERIIAKLKHLESGFGALNYMLEKDGSKLSPDTLFIKTIGYDEIMPKTYTQKIPNMPDATVSNQKPKINARLIKANISVALQEQKKMPAYVRLCYLGAFMKEDRITSNKVDLEYKLIKSREYSLEFLSDHKKLIKRVEFRASRQIQLNL
ncbi:MAG: hypothetical protein BK997_01515 [Candidatus Micrarchaeum sp. ARMAN-1]|jgi:Cdc6-like AAA superfamily ATPase|nr:MAG: hypothetical protein BK997_01515 [Candidatus Micrarchaeum sp. ARMAN-1]